MQCRITRHHGFTLVELLVVVSIIALLIAILLPSLASAGRQARTVVCLAQLSQLGEALQIYADRHRGSVPQVYGGSVSWGQEHGAMYQLVVASGLVPEESEFPKLLICSEARPRGSISYALNAVLFGYKDPLFLEDPEPDALPEGTLNIPPMRLWAVKNPAKVVALYDVRVESLARVCHVPLDLDEADISDQFTATGMLGAARPNPAGFMWQQSLDEPPVTADTPHGRGHNVLFADMHVATHTRWDPKKMTRLVGQEPHDSFLH